MAETIENNVRRLQVGGIAVELVRKEITTAQDLLEPWESKVGAQVEDVRVRRMKTRG